MSCMLPTSSDAVEHRFHRTSRRGGLLVLLAATLLLGACERDSSATGWSGSWSEDGGEHAVQPAPDVQIIDPSRQMPLPRDQQRLPLTRVLQIAQAAIPGEVIEVELDDDDDDDDPEYEITILTAQGRKMEVKIDARSGAILEIEED